MKRALYSKLLERLNSPEAIVITGMRRVGKTTLLKQVYEDLQSDNKIILDLENPINQKYFGEENYEAIRYTLETLGITLSKQAYVFLDEIQFVRNIPSVVKYLIDHYKIKFFLTGSSSFYLKNLFSESLAGRKIIYELYPLNFTEFLSLKKSTLKIPEIVSKTFHLTIKPLYQEYIEYGGFPGVVTKNSIEEKREALNEIFTSYYNKEVLGLGGFKSNKVVRDLMLLLMNRVGSKVDVQKLSSELGISRITLNDYLAFLEGTYFISLIAPYSTNKDTEIRGAKKVYLCDSGLANILGDIPFGSVFENAIYHQLRTQGEVKYYQRKNGVEIDFILDEKMALEVKTKATRQDSSRLERLKTNLALDDGKVISFEYVDIPMSYGFQV